MNHGFIGFGNLARAIYEGLKDEDQINFAYFDIDKKETEVHFFNNLNQLISFSDIIWLTVKPQDLKNILKQVEPLNRNSKVFVSPIAGKKIELIESYLGTDQPIARIMPNLAIAYKKSVTSFTTNQPNNPNTEEVFHIISKLGKAVKINEDDFDLFTSIFGSGPAFILSYLKSFKDKMQEFNLPDYIMNALLLELAEGTITYFSENYNQLSIEELTKNITSKGGTTQAGLDYLYKHEVDKHLEGVIDSARERAIEMGKDEG